MSNLLQTELSLETTVTSHRAEQLSPCGGGGGSWSGSPRIFIQRTCRGPGQALQRPPGGEASLGPEHFWANGGKGAGDMSTLLPSPICMCFWGAESHRTKRARWWGSDPGGQSRPQGSLPGFVLNVLLRRMLFRAPLSGSLMKTHRRGFA